MSRPGDRVAAAAVSDESPAAAVDQALARIEATRQQLRRQLVPQRVAVTRDGVAVTVTGTPAAQPAGLFSRLKSAWQRWRISKHLSLTKLLGNALQNWWQRQPLHLVGGLVSRQLRQSVPPQVEQRPLVAISAAAAVGAALVLARPWRLLNLGARGRPLHYRIAHWLGRQLRKTPVQLALISAVVAAAREAQETDAGVPPAAASGRRL